MGCGASQEQLKGGGNGAPKAAPKKKPDNGPKVWTPYRFFYQHFLSFTIHSSILILKNAIYPYI